MESQDLQAVLADIVNRLKALEASSGQKTRPEDCITQNNGPHEEVTWDTVLPSTLAIPCDTTPCVLPLLCGVPSPLGQMTGPASNTLKHERTSQTEAPRRSKPQRKDDQTPRLLTREEEKRITADTIPTWRSQQQTSFQTTAASQDIAWQKPAWTAKNKGAQSTSNSRPM